MEKQDGRGILTTRFAIEDVEPVNRDSAVPRFEMVGGLY